MGARGLSQPGGMVEGQILKAVDSAVEGGGEGLVLAVGMSPPLLPSPLPPQWLPAVLWKNFRNPHGV
jgi:hypothetical protein